MLVDSEDEVCKETKMEESQPSGWKQRGFTQIQTFHLKNCFLPSLDSPPGQKHYAFTALMSAVSQPYSCMSVFIEPIDQPVFRL